MTTIAPDTVIDDLTEGPRVEVSLTPGTRTDILRAGINRWAALEGFPARDEILMELVTDQGLIEMDAAKARAAVVQLRAFADQLAGLADQLDALGGQ